MNSLVNNVITIVLSVAISYAVIKPQAEYKAEKAVEIFTDEFGTHAQLKEYPEDGCVTLELK